jgi:hypothetical protein
VLGWFNSRFDRLMDRIGANEGRFEEGARGGVFGTLNY